MKTKTKKPSRMMRKLNSSEKELLREDRIINTMMANTLYNLAQSPSLTDDTRKALKDICDGRDDHRSRMFPLVERLLN